MPGMARPAFVWSIRGGGYNIGALPQTPPFSNLHLSELFAKASWDSMALAGGALPYLLSGLGLRWKDFNEFIA